MADDKTGKRQTGERLRETQSRQWNQMLSGLILNDALHQGQSFCGHEETEERLEDRLWCYAEGLMDVDEQRQFWDKIKNCLNCLPKLARMLQALESVENESTWAADRLVAVIQEKKRHDILMRISDRLGQLRSNLFDRLGGRFEQVADGLKSKFQASFIYPAPRFYPVYGTPHLLANGPFGKVRHPIIFEWLPDKRATNYILSIQDVQWVKETTQNKVILEAGACDLAYGQEYMWELAVLENGEVVVEESGFITVATEAEIEELERIENALQDLTDGYEKNLIFAGILEQMGFYAEAIHHYSLAYEEDPIPSIAFRIADCYDQLEVKELAAKWNQEIPPEKAND